MWSNVGALNLNLWVHTLVELWGWDRPAEQLRDRSESPWDDADRRPSHADRRKALQRQMLEEAFQRGWGRLPLPPIIRHWSTEWSGWWPDNCQSLESAVRVSWWDYPTCPFSHIALYWA